MWLWRSLRALTLLAVVLAGGSSGSSSIVVRSLAGGWARIGFNSGDRCIIDHTTEESFLVDVVITKMFLELTVGDDTLVTILGEEIVEFNQGA